MEHESINRIEKHDKNPYIKEVLKYIKGKDTRVGYFKEKTDLELINTNTSEITPFYNAIYKKTSVDVQQYNKIYVSGITALFDLNKTEQKVLKYIYTKLEKNKDYIFFSIKDCKEMCEYSSNQIIHTAIAGLVKKELIAKTTESFKLWINPTIMFNGDRMIMIQEYIRK